MRAFLVLASLSLGLFGAGVVRADSSPSVIAGRIDLTNWDFAIDGDVALLGTWEICWGSLLMPGEACPTGWGAMPVRGLWIEEGDSPLGGHGVATYRLRIALAPGSAELTLLAGSPHTAHRLFIDGFERGGAGVIGPTAETTEMGVHSHLYNLQPANDEIEFLLQVANFEFRSGGLKRIWYLGLPESIQKGIGRAIVREGMVLGVGVIVGLAYLLLFALGPSERARGYFGLLTLVVGLRVIPASISGLGDLIAPGAPFELLTRSEYFGNAMIVFAGAGYVRTKTRGVAPPRALWGIQLVALALAATVAFAPFKVALATLPLQFALAPLLLSLLILFYGWAWHLGRGGVRVTAAAGLVYLAVVLHDVIRTIHADFGARIELYPYAIVLWILIEGAELMRRFYQTFTQVESLSEQLADKNFELQEAEAAIVRFVPFNFLRMLGKQKIHEIEAGDQIRARMSVLDCAIHLDVGSIDADASESALDFVQQLVDAIEPLIHHREGFVTELRAGGFQAIFPEDASGACAAGYEIMRATRRLNSEGSPKGGSGTRVTVGIDTGPVLLRMIGTSQHLLWGVVGEAVEGARRIGARVARSESTLLISGAVRDVLSDASDFDIVRIEEFVPGEAEDSFEIYQVLPRTGSALD